MRLWTVAFRGSPDRSTVDEWVPGTGAASQPLAKKKQNKTTTKEPGRGFSHRNVRGAECIHLYIYKKGNAMVPMATHNPLPSGP